MRAAPEDEAALIERARNGDGDAQDALLRRYLGDVHGLTARMLRDPDLAADATQEALLGALQGLARFRGDASFRTWLLRIAANAARTAARRSGRRRETKLEDPTVLVDPAPDPERTAAARIEAEQARAMLDRLPNKQRLTVILRIHHGLSYAEIATITETSEGAARVNYHLGIRRLRELLA